MPHDSHTRWWWGSSTLGSKRADPVPTSSRLISPISARSFSVWYTVRSDTVGMRATTAECTDSAVGCVGLSCSASKTATRCGVIFRPWDRNCSVSAAGVFTGTNLGRPPPNLQPLLEIKV